MFREILPNMASIVMSTFIACVIFGIGAQAGLEFLGLGDMSMISWGTNLYWASNDGALLTRHGGCSSRQAPLSRSLPSRSPWSTTAWTRPPTPAASPRGRVHAGAPTAVTASPKRQDR